MLLSSQVRLGYVYLTIARDVFRTRGIQFLGKTVVPGDELWTLWRTPGAAPISGGRLLFSLIIQHLHAGARPRSCGQAGAQLWKDAGRFPQPSPVLPHTHAYPPCASAVSTHRGGRAPRSYPHRHRVIHRNARGYPQHGGYAGRSLAEDASMARMAFTCSRSARSCSSAVAIRSMPCMAVV